jgi:hypothetical protein
VERLLFILWLAGASLIITVLEAPAQAISPAAAAIGAPTGSASNGFADSVISNLPDSTPIREISPGVLQIADVTINPSQRTVSFPARLNLDSSPMEYFLVTSWGKIHESVLQTSTQPYRIHVGMLLLGARGAGTNAGDDGPPVTFISHPPNIRIPGDNLAVEVSWTNAAGAEMRRRAGAMIFNREKNSIIEQDDWAYNGSRTYENYFVAQSDGSIVSLVTDPAALVNNNGPGHDNDGVWIPNATNLPPSNLTVQVTFKLIDPQPGK